LLQCRPFSVFNEKRLQTCHPYLKNTTHYYLVRRGGGQASRYKTFPGSIDHELHSVLFHCMQQAYSPWIDDSVPGFSLVTQMANIIKNALNPTCASNVISLLCHSVFKECVRVQDESSRGELWLPSLLCRGACYKHREIWTQCLIDLESDPAAKSNFDTQMLSLVRHMMSMVCIYTLSKLIGTSFPCTGECAIAWCKYFFQCW
jgi:hypothetical protein